MHRNVRGDTPLIYVARSGRKDILRILVEYGADITVEGIEVLAHTLAFVS